MVKYSSCLCIFHGISLDFAEAWCEYCPGQEKMKKIIVTLALLVASGAGFICAGEGSVTPAEFQLNASGIKAMNIPVPSAPVKAGYHSPGGFGYPDPGYPGYPGHHGHHGHHGYPGYPGHSGHTGHTNPDTGTDTDADTDADENSDSDEDEDEDIPVQLPYIRCQQVSTMEVLARIAGSEEAKKISRLARLICSFPSDPAATVKYPDGTIAYVGREYSDAGSWKYPDGYHAYVGAYYSDTGSWKYPNGQLAYFGPGYKEKESWKYPNGGYAYVGPYYQDSGSWKYPSGYHAYVGGWYSDTGSWKYSSGKYAYSTTGGWRYPNGAQCTPGSPMEGIDTLLSLVEAATNSEFPYVPAIYSAMEGSQTLSKLQWIERKMTALGGISQDKGTGFLPVNTAAPVTALNVCPEAPGGCCSSARASSGCDLKSASPVQ